MSVCAVCRAYGPTTTMLHAHGLSFCGLPHAEMYERRHPLVVAS